MEKRNLLDYLSNEHLDALIPCFKPTTMKYPSGDTIMAYESELPSKIAVMVKGKSILEIYNADGDIFLAEEYNPGDIFGELFALPMGGFHYVVTASTDCVVLYLDYHHVVEPCSKTCPHHSQLLSNLLVMTAQKTQELSMHVSILGQTSIRSKLLAYLRYIQSQSGGKARFDIPMSLGRLSEYLKVNRSAMMRELKAMKNDGLIENTRRSFELKNIS